MQQQEFDLSRCKPFNLERAMAGDPVVTRDGKTFKFGAHNQDANEYEQVIGWVEGYAHRIAVNGRFYSYGNHHLDLFMAPITKILYYAIVKGSASYFPTGFYLSEEALRSDADRLNWRILYLRTIEIEEE